MIELNASTLNAATLTAPDILSLIPTLEAPAESTNSSATTAQDFSAMLTEMIGAALPAAVSSASTLTIAGPAQSTTLSATMPQNITVQTAQPAQPTQAQPPAATLTVQTALPQQPAQPAQPVQPAQSAQPAQPAVPVAAAPIELPLPQMPQPTQRAPIQVQPIPAAPAPSDVTPAQTNEQTATLPQLQIEQGLPKSLMPEKPKDPAKTQDPQTAQPAQTDPTAVMPVLPFVPVAVASCAASGEKPVPALDTQSQQPKVGEPAVASAPIALPPALQQEVQRAWADVRKFEFKVQVETARPAAQGQPLAAPAELPRQAIVTTDPLANIQLQQLPPRITAIEKLAPEARLADRARPEAEHQTTDSSTAAPVMHFADMTQPVEHVEQAQAAHTVEIPNLPHVQVVRTVSMEVGEADSQVTVRIQERGGDISLQINAGNEPLHQDLQSSLGSLVHALKQEQVQVSNVEVSRKSPIEKVRRMKEAN